MDFWDLHKMDSRQIQNRELIGQLAHSSFNRPIQRIDSIEIIETVINDE